MQGGGVELARKARSLYSRKSEFVFCLGLSIFLSSCPLPQNQSHPSYPMVYQRVSSCYQGGLPSCSRKVLAHVGSSDCWDFLSI